MASARRGREEEEDDETGGGAATTTTEDAAAAATTTAEAEGDGRHTERHFADRIEALRATIRAGLPPPPPSADGGGGGRSSSSSSPPPSSVRALFADTTVAVRSCADARRSAGDLLERLKKAPNNAGDADLVAEARTVVDRCQGALDAAWESEVGAGGRLMDELDLESVEASLLECTVLVQNTPKGLADFCARGKSSADLVDGFLSDKDRMKLMISAGGASFGDYGSAVEIHSDLLGQIETRGGGSTEVRRKLALAVALEHATPVPYRFRPDRCVDPSARFWHYADAYENGELDPAFGRFTAWELRFVVDSDATEEELQWGRDYLKAYRPDQVTSTSDRWKYIWTVRTDINYHHPEHDFHNYKELLSAGGVCGARAWFGRFIAKSFGMPTWGVRQPGHAAISRWTPSSGWVTCLGAGFGFSHFTERRYAAGKRTDRGGLDFEEETLARTNARGCYYGRVCLVECLAESLGETIMETVDPAKCWRSLSLAQRRSFARASKDHRATRCEESGRGAIGAEASSSSSSPSSDREADREIRRQDKCYVIPASNFSNPPSKALLVMPSFLGGDQVHLCSSKYMGDDGGDDGDGAFRALHQEAGGVTYAIPPAVPDGFYRLSFKIVTVHRFQPKLHLSAEGGDDDDAVVVHEIEVPNTVGAWKMTPGVRLYLNPGSVIRISRESPCHGLTMKELVLDPIT